MREYLITEDSRSTSCSKWAFPSSQRTTGKGTAYSRADLVSLRVVGTSETRALPVDS
jgi:hypothetical protein